jgi:hypothetical protein
MDRKPSGLGVSQGMDVWPSRPKDRIRNKGWEYSAGLQDGGGHQVWSRPIGEIRD